MGTHQLTVEELGGLDVLVNNAGMVLTMPPDMDCQRILPKPAVRISSASVSGAGNLRMDSARYW